MERMDRLKNVQISQELFFDLVRFHLLEMEELSPEIQKGLEAKLEAMLKRELYTKYKTAPTEEERERARKEYLDKVGIHRDFLACSRSSSVGAVLYFVYNSRFTIASNFTSKPFCISGESSSISSK